MKLSDINVIEDPFLPPHTWYACYRLFLIGHRGTCPDCGSTIVAHVKTAFFGPSTGSAQVITKECSSPQCNYKFTYTCID